MLLQSVIAPHLAALATRLDCRFANDYSETSVATSPGRELHTVQFVSNFHGARGLVELTIQGGRDGVPYVRALVSIGYGYAPGSVHTGTSKTLDSVECGWERDPLEFVTEVCDLVRSRLRASIGSAL